MKIKLTCAVSIALAFMPLTVHAQETQHINSFGVRIQQNHDVLCAAYKDYAYANDYFKRNLFLKCIGDSKQTNIVESERQCAIKAMQDLQKSGNSAFLHDYVRPKVPSNTFSSKEIFDMEQRLQKSCGHILQ